MHTKSWLLNFSGKDKTILSGGGIHFPPISEQGLNEVTVITSGEITPVGGR
jgi:hypothetical protein